MRIAIFTDNFREDMGGGTKIVIDLARGLRDKGHEILVVTGQGTDRTIEEFRAFHLPSVRVPFYDKAEMVFPSSKLLREIRFFKPDILHYHEPFTAGMIALLLSKLLDLPAVGSIYIDPRHLSEYSLKVDRGAFAKTLVGFMGRQSSALIFISNYHRETYRKFLPKDLKIKVIYPGIPETFFSRKKVKREKRVITVCRLAPEKNLRFAFKVMAEVQREEPIGYLVAGDGPERGKLERLARKLGLKIKFLGNLPREELADLYRTSRIFFLPSKTETFGLVFAEAMASGTPVVALDRGSAPEVIGNGGIVCEEDEYLVAEVILSLLRDEKLWKWKSDKAKKRAELFKMERFISEHEELYAYVLRKA